MTKGMNVDPHKVYCDVVDAIELGTPIVLSHTIRAIFPQVARLAEEGKENARTQLLMPDVRNDPDTCRHLAAVIGASDVAGWYAVEPAMARAYQQAGCNEIASDLFPADPSELAPRHDVDGFQTFPGHRL